MDRQEAVMTDKGLKRTSLAAALFIFEAISAGAAAQGGAAIVHRSGAQAVAAGKADTGAKAAKPGQSPCEKEMLRASKQHGVPIGMLYAVGLTETGRAGSLQPYALNVEGKASYGLTLNQAMKLFDDARKSGAKLIDLGCMQINHYYHAAHFASVRDMFDPAQNVDYAARFLKQLYAQEGTWTLAVARYNAGPNNNPAQKRYVCRVIANMVATGFGAWTPAARQFCGA
jgi:soluble lytic murein transglycosylase-like protein